VKRDGAYHRRGPFGLQARPAVSQGNVTQMDVNQDLPDAQTEVSIALRQLSEAWRNRRYDELRE
jgi:hypothetical protein